MNRGAWQAAISGVAKELDTIEQLSNILDITSGLSKKYRNSLYNFCKSQTLWAIFTILYFFQIRLKLAGCFLHLDLGKPVYLRNRLSLVL